LYNAKISTLGERVEDTFYIRDKNNQTLTNDISKALRETICSELDLRNQQANQETNFQSISIGQ
jgi:[protein-PII] uridylyltransferase